MLDISVQTGVDGKQYKVCGGTCYHADTQYDVISWLETFRERYQRIRVTFGTVENGQVIETHKRVGYVSRSLGPVKAPLLVFSNRSLGGEVISTERVVMIEYANKRYCEKVVWSNPVYQTVEVQGVLS